MRILRVALAQINPTVGALEANADRMIQLIKQASDRHVDIIAFPELAITGYPPEDLVLKPEFVADNQREVERVAAAVADLTAIVGFVDSDGTDIYNAAAVIQQGRIIGVHRKFFLPNYSVFDEQRYFAAGSEWSVYRIRDVEVGVTICEDIWYPIGPATLEAMAGAEVIVNINASPYRVGKHEQRQKMIATRALDGLSFVCYLNTVGGQDELVFEGASMIADPDGDVIVQGAFFEEDFLLADLDVDAVFSSRLHDTRRRQNSLPPGVEMNEGGELVETPLSSPIERTSLKPLPPTVRELPNRLAEIYGALVLGTRDYVRKNGFERVFVGLSGGIDSSLTCCIAVDAVGPTAVTGISNPSRYSSQESRTDARLLAENLGIELLTIPIEEPFRAYLETLEPIFQGHEPNVTEENLQARIRGNIWMAMTNKFGGIVLTAGNKSETAVGYATLYGDMAGGFAVLKDVYKTTIYELARYKNVSAGRELIPQDVLEKAPSAELRPDQRDQDTLPPYDELDGILRLYIEEDRSAGDIVAHGYDARTVTKVISMVDAAEYKRRQAPPGVKISGRAFGKDRRLPVTNQYRDLPEEAPAEVAEAIAKEASDKVREGTR